MKTFEGKLIPQNIKVGIVAARFNEFITSKLLSGAMDVCSGIMCRRLLSMSHGFRVLLRSHWLPLKWQKAESMML